MNGPLCAVPVVTTLSSDDRASVRGPCGRSWVAPGASVGGPGPLMGPQWAVLGCSWGLSGRSWAAPGASVGGPGLPLGSLWSVLGSFRGFCGVPLGCPWASWGRSSAALGRKVALSRAGRPFGAGAKRVKRVEGQGYLKILGTRKSVQLVPPPHPTVR